MKNIFLIVCAVALCLIVAMFYSCGKENRWDCIKRTGKPATETRVLTPFTKIYVKDNIDVIISRGNTPQVKIETGSNLISLIKTEVDSGILHISNGNRCNWARSYKNGSIKVYVTMPTLRFLWHFGTGLVKSDDTLTCDTLDIWAHQTGNVDLKVNANIIYTNMHTTADITLHGRSGLFGSWHTGEGFLHCEDLQADIAWTHSKASGDEYINARSILSATIDWEGNIYYSGHPVTSADGKGKGKLIQQ